jgi:hypothetical protein
MCTWLCGSYVLVGAVCREVAPYALCLLLESMRCRVSALVWAAATWQAYACSDRRSDSWPGHDPWVITQESSTLPSTVTSSCFLRFRALHFPAQSVCAR